MRPQPLLQLREMAWPWPSPLGSQHLSLRSKVKMLNFKSTGRIPTRAAFYGQKVCTGFCVIPRLVNPLLDSVADSLFFSTPSIVAHEGDDVVQIDHNTVFWLPLPRLAWFKFG